MHLLGEQDTRIADNKYNSNYQAIGVLQKLYIVSIHLPKKSRGLFLTVSSRRGPRW